MRELNARPRLDLRHRSAAEPGSATAELQVGRLSLDPVHHQATFGGQELELTPREFDFLAYLARDAGKVCTRRMILENVLGPVTGTRSIT
jgi:two-component system, OmpR family, KDP operon response regulator KdpE